VQWATDDALSACAKSRITGAVRWPGTRRSTSIMDSARLRSWSKPSSTSARDTVLTGTGLRVR
jgi:hypothetical protein